LSQDDLLSEFSVKIYARPLSDLRTSGAIRDPSNPVAVVMLVIDLETEVSMNGILNFLGNRTGLFARETVTALRTVGAEEEAGVLDEILAVSSGAGMTHDAIQADRAGLERHAVTSFSKLHGEKWDAAVAEVLRLGERLDFETALARTAAFVERHRPTFESALRGGSTSEG
jgi:hypothetical protein